MTLNALKHIYVLLVNERAEAISNNYYSNAGCTVAEIYKYILEVEAELWKEPECK